MPRSGNHSAAAMLPVRGAVTGSLVLLVIAALLVAVLAWRSEPDALATSPRNEAVTVPVTQLTTDDAVQTTATLAAEEPFQVVSGRSGIVTDVLARPGMELRAADRVIELSDAPVLAFVAAAPLHRDLGPGDRGADVARLQRYLRATTEASLTVDGNFGPATVDAVAELRDATGMPAAASIGPAELAWVGAAPIRVVAAPVSVGDHVNEGEPILEGPPRRVRLDVTADLSGFPENEDLVLSVGGQDVPIATDGMVTEEWLGRLFDTLGPFEDQPAVVALAAPVTRPQVPASAVVTDESGATCLVATDESTVVVDVLETSFGRALLSGGTDDLPTTVVANPQVLDAEC